MNILQTESSPNWGGQEYETLLESRELVKRGHKVIFAINHANTKMIEMAQTFGLPFYSVYFRNSVDLISMRRIFKIIQKHKINIIHCHSPKDHWVCYPFYRYLNIPILRWRDITLSVPSTWRRSYIYRHGCKYLLVRCEAIKKAFVKNNKVKPEKIFVIPVGIDLKLFHPNVDGTSIRKEFNIPLDVPLIGIIGMLRGDKGHKYFIEGANLLLQKNQNVYFLIVGSGIGKETTAKELKKQVKTLNLEKRIIFTGYRKDIPQIIASLNILVLTSICGEAMSRVIPEALAMKKPVIGTTIGGIPEVIQHKKTGILIPPKNSEAVANAIKFLLKHPQKAKEMAERGYEFVKKNFALSSIIDKIELIQEKALKENIH